MTPDGELWTGEQSLERMDRYVETDEQKQLREAVRHLAQRFGHSYYLEVSRRQGHATALWTELSRAGYTSVNLPEEYGGSGGGIADLAIVCEELAAAGTPSFMLIVSSAICGELLTHHGSEEQKAEWLPRMAAGETKLAFSITEPDAG